MRDVAMFGAGALVAVVVFSRLKSANESTCCARVAAAVREKLNDATLGLGGGALDALGLTKHSPALLDAFGVPLDA